MIVFAVDTTDADEVLLACAVTAIFPAARLTMLTMGLEHIIPELVQSAIDADDKEGLKALSQHPIQNAFYEGICLGGNKRGIHGMSPGEPLHVLELHCKMR
jgi:hypothetical protein